MATTLTITGWEGGTLNLNDGVNYRLGEGWAPKVARRRSEPLAGYSPFERQQETIPLRVFGSSPTAALGAAHKLAQALDQARRWANGEAVAAVLLNYKPDGAAGNTLPAAIWGGEGDGLTLPPTFNKNIQAFEISPVDLTVLRDGDWLDAEETAPTSTTVNNLEKMTATFSAGAVKVDSPLELRLSYVNYDVDTFLVLPPAFIVHTKSANRLVVADSQHMAPNGPFTAASDTGTQSRTGSVLRYTPTDTNFHATGENFSFNSTARRVAIFFNLRSNISAVTWYVKAGIQTGPLSVKGPDTSVTAIPGADIANPKWYFLGIVSSVLEVQGVNISVKASTTTGSPVLDSDAYVMVAVDGAWAGAPALQAFSSTAKSGAWSLRLQHMALSEIRPAASLYGGPTRLFSPVVLGNRYLLTDGDTVAASYLATDGANWRMENGAGSLLTTSMTVLRRPAYLIPE